MKYEINLDNKILDFLKVKLNISKDEIIDLKKKINEIINLAVKHEKINADKIYVSISSATQEQIKDLNNKYRKIDKVTDVLSFPIFSKEEFDEIRNNKQSKDLQLELGDIILCLDIVEEHSIEYNTGLVREILYMITHGICHLLGYDHIELYDKKCMRQLEEEILTKIGVNED